MKLVIAIIKPFKLDEVREALTQLGITGIAKPHNFDYSAVHDVQYGFSP